jgi:putative two-component system response regulator
LRHAKIIVGAHHEKRDGTGYPAGLKGKEIPLEGGLMAIADVCDALISERPYNGPYTSAQAEAIIREGWGKHFDLSLMDMFQQLADGFAEVAKRYC